MINIFTDVFASTFLAVIQILIIAVAAGLLVRRNIVSSDHIKALSLITIRVLLPCLIFASITKNFYPDQLRFWPLLPLAAIAMVAIGLVAGAALFAHELPQKKGLLSIASMQNAGYLVLPIGAILFPEKFEEFKLYCFLYVLGLSPLLWSLGKYLVSPPGNSKITLRDLITPPLMANIIGLLLVFTHTRNLVPSILSGSIEMLGSATVPIATFILGAMLGSISFTFKRYLLDAVRVILVKLIIIPICTIAILYFIDLGSSHPLLAAFLVIQSSAAPATAIVIQVKHYGGNEEEVSSITLLTYISCVITMPFWLALWNAISA